MADLYGAITDKAVNTLIRILMTFRPSLFNYAAPIWNVVADTSGKPIGVREQFLSCRPVALPPGSDPATTPRFTRVDYLPAPGLGIKLLLPWCIQVTDIEVDFQPRNIVTLPPEIPTLPPQSFVLRVRVAFGLACPTAELINGLLNYSQSYLTSAKYRPNLPLNVLPVTALRCFSLDGFGVCTLERQVVGSPPSETVGVALGQLEIVDLGPAGLEDVMECYLTTLVRVVVQPQLALALQRAVSNALGMVSTVKPRFAPGLPHNPAVEHNELRVWVDVDI